MAAQIHPIAAIVDRLGDPAHLNVGLEYDGYDRRAAQQFQGSGQPGRTRSRHDGEFAHANGARAVHDPAIVEVPVLLPRNERDAAARSRHSPPRPRNSAADRHRCSISRSRVRGRTDEGFPRAPLCALVIFDNSLQSGSISGSSTCDRRRTSSGGRSREDHAGGLINRQIAGALQREPRERRRVVRPERPRHWPSGGMARRQSEYSLTFAAVPASPPSASARGTQYRQAATSAPGNQRQNDWRPSRPNPACNRPDPCNHQHASRIPAPRTRLPTGSLKRPRIDQRINANTKQVVPAIVENVHAQITSEHAPSHRTSQRAIEPETSAPRVARSRESSPTPIATLVLAREWLTGPTRLPMSATANPAAPTSIAVAQILRTRASSIARTLSDSDRKGRAFRLQSVARQSFRKRNCERSRTTSSQAASITTQVIPYGWLDCRDQGDAQHQNDARPRSQGAQPERKPQANHPQQAG